jgi:membrane-associated phospholipid phosphatase
VITNHRRAFAWSLVLLVCCVVGFVTVGRHPAAAAPQTSIAAIGRFDLTMWRAVDDIRVTPLTWLFRLLNVLGGGLITIPLRALGAVVLLVRRRWRALAAFALTWASSELAVTWLKSYYHRGRPSGALVDIVGYSFPSGHAVAGAATAVAFVLAFLPPGPGRRRWEWLAVAFSFTMAFSRVYLRAHWFSDVVVGTMLGAGLAIFWFALFTELRDVWAWRHPGELPIVRGEVPEAGETISG